MRSLFIRMLFVLGLLYPSFSQAVVPMVSVGYRHSLLLQADGTLQSWGYNGYGELGDGTIANRFTPVVVPGLNGLVSVAAGAYHTVAIQSDGTLVAWGNNAQGQLGIGTTTQQLNPVVVPGLTGIVAIAASSHTVALKSDGTVLTWGSNQFGQLGDGSATQRLSPTQVMGLSGVVAVAAGSSHTLALKSDGTVVAWGYNGFGQLGDGTTNQQLSPVPVVGLTGVVAVAAGAYYSVALKSDGTMVAWGHNSYGQLGDGTTTQRLNPVPVTGLSGVVSIEAGYYHTVAIKSDSTVLTWGQNSYGQLGDGTTTQQLIPTVVPGLSGVVRVAADIFHTVALKADGTVMAWGLNDYGQLGDGTATQRLSPVAVSGLRLFGLPILSFSADVGYGTAGVSPSTGSASTVLTYKVVYTHAANTAPSSILVCIDTAVCSAMSLDTTAGSALQDGNYINGEQFVYSTSLAAGAHTYYFTASDGSASVSFPSAALVGPAVSSLVISNANLADGIVGDLYSQTLVANGGTAPYAWSSGSLPAGLSFNASTGVVSGTPAIAGLTGFNVSVTDAAGTVVSKLFLINVTVANLNIVTTTLANGTVGAIYTQAILANGGAAPYVWTSGLLPLGLSFNSSTGAVSGTPTTVGVTSFNVNVSDTLGSTATRIMAINVVPAPAPVASITSTSLNFGNQNIGIPSASQSVTLSNVGNAALNISGIAVSGDYAQNSNCGTTLQAGANCVINIIFTPTASSARNGVLTIGSNAASPQSVSLSGNGTYDVDLVATAVSTVSKGIIGGILDINSTVTNSGTTVTAAYSEVQYHLSTSATSNTKTLLLGSSYISGLAAGTNRVVTTTATIPANLAPRLYYLWMTVDVGNAEVESNETNNILAGNAITIIRDVDLVATAVSTAATANIGTNLSIASTVTNSGTMATAANSSVQYHLSTSATSNTKTLLLGSSYISGLAAGTSRVVTTTATIPANLAPRLYYLWMTVDVGNAEVESNETNNILAGNAITIIRDVDLVATAVSTAATANIGTNLSIASTVTNSGTTVTAAYSEVQYHLSTSATSNTKTLLLGSSYISGLAAGTSRVVTTTATIPANLAPRLYYLWMTVDVGNAEVESNETNNILAGNAITIIRDVDLVATAVSTAATANIGTNLSIASTVTNSGTTVTAAYSEVQYHLSTSATSNTKTLLLGSSYISGLAAGTSRVVTTTATIPANLAPRLYYLWMTVDVGNAEVESNETNNILAGNAITIIRDVDLVPTVVSTVASANRGNSISIASTVANNGTTVTAAYSEAQYHLSTSATSNTKTLLLGSSYISGLAAGTSRVVTTTATIPANLAPRLYYLWMTVDVGNAEVESNETNNVLVGNAIAVQ